MKKRSRCVTYDDIHNAIIGIIVLIASVILLYAVYCKGYKQGEYEGCTEMRERLIDNDPNTANFWVNCL